MRSVLAHRFIVLIATLALAGACGDDSSADGDGGNAGTDGSTIDADPNPADADPFAPDAPPPADSGPCVPQSCGGHVTECLDCADNDMDGLIDSADPECLGPCDNTEGAALTAGVGGEGGQTCKMDCYFDFGNGSGNDECFWDHTCDIETPRDNCPYDQTAVGTANCPATQGTLCHDVCSPLTPNGCDCFGCCTFEGLDRYVYIGTMDGNTGTCTFDVINDEAKCRTCTPVADCLNECGTCELCIGQTELPPECTDEERCDPGVQPCGLPGDAECPQSFFCVSGCCQAIVD